MSTVLRYTLFQIPGWLVGAAVSALVAAYGVLPAGWAAALLALWVLKDAALYPFVRRSYEPGRPAHADLIGTRAVAQETLAPTGYVALQGQLWRAEVQGAGRVAAGDAVRVRAVDGLTLRVVPEAAE